MVRVSVCFAVKDFAKSAEAYPELSRHKNLGTLHNKSDEKDVCPYKSVKREIT